MNKIICIEKGCLDVYFSKENSFARKAAPTPLTAKPVPVYAVNLSLLSQKVKVNISGNMEKFAESIKSIQENLKILNTTVRKLDTKIEETKQSVISMNTKMNTFIDEIEQTIEMVLSKKLEKIQEDVDKKIEDVRNTAINNNSAKAAIKTHKAAIEGIDAFDKGIFIPDIIGQFNAANSDKFNSVFRGKTDALSTYQTTQYSLQFLSEVLGDDSNDKASMDMLLRNRILLEKAFAIGNKTKGLIMKFATSSSAQKLREIIMDYNIRQSSKKLPPLKFSRCRTGVKAVDEAMQTGNRILFTAKRNKLISSYMMAPKLADDVLSLTTQTRIRLLGEVHWNTLNWSSQSEEQAVQDFLASLIDPDQDQVSKFKKAITDAEERRSGSNPLPQRRRRPTPQ